MRIAVIGTGYVGLVSGACFADFGHRVCCVDKDASKIDRLNDGVMPIWEPGLEALVKANVGHGRLTFTTDLPAAVEDAEAVFIAVGTPARRGDGHADLTYVFDAVREMARVISRERSSLPSRRCRSERATRLSKSCVKKASPKLPSRRIRSFCAKAPPSRTSSIPIELSSAPRTSVPRACCAKSIGRFSSIGHRSCHGPAPAAELTKYAANAFLAVKISFINEIADLCEAVDADVQDVARGIGLDNRIGAEFLHAGPGYGGSCFPKDTLALLQTADAAGRRPADRQNDSGSQ